MPDFRPCWDVWKYPRVITRKIGRPTISRLAPKLTWHISISACQSLSQFHGHTALQSSSPSQKTPICRWNLNLICYSYRAITISGFVGHCWLSAGGCRNGMVHGHIFFELPVIENHKCNVRIPLPAVLVPEIKTFPVLAVTLLFPLSIVVYQSPANSFFELSVGISMLSVVFPDTGVRISGLAAYCHFLLSVVVVVRRQLPPAHRSRKS